MFRRNLTDEVSSTNQMKGSVANKTRSYILETYPRLEEVFNDILPKKAPLLLSKCSNHVSLLLTAEKKVPLFFKYRESTWLPTLRLLHQYPSMMAKMQIDTGGVKHVMRGSNVMCQGLTSAGGRMENVGSGVPVQILGESCDDVACAVGMTQMSTEDIKSVNKGVCVQTLHHLGDSLWQAEI
eukprot:Lankesteria_metandrocarpae@DN4533_c0_g1_i2.p3